MGLRVSPAAEIRLLGHHVGQLPPPAGQVVQHRAELVQDVSPQSAEIYASLSHFRLKRTEMCDEESWSPKVSIRGCGGDSPGTGE